MAEKQTTDPNEFRALIHEAREAIFKATAMHERSEHAGAPCWNERCNAIAFLCHALQLQPRHIAEVAELLRAYDDRHHGEHSHGHAEGH